jgi:uncharacterized protein YukE
MSTTQIAGMIDNLKGDVDSYIRAIDSMIQQIQTEIQKVKAEFDAGSQSFESGLVKANRTLENTIQQLKVAKTSLDTVKAALLRG